MWRVLILAVRWNVLDDARYATMLVEHTRLILHHINPFCTMYSTIPPNTREGSLANNRSHRRRRKNSREKSEEATTLPPPTQFQSRTEFERPTYHHHHGPDADPTSFHHSNQFNIQPTSEVTVIKYCEPTKSELHAKKSITSLSLQNINRTQTFTIS